jgi:S1-C subfamily serine protease
LYAAESERQIIVTGLARAGPADRAGVKLGDVVREVSTHKICDLADFYRKVWRLGPAGTSIPITLLRDGHPVHVRVESIDRASIMHRPQLQ